ncbi:MAG TPA: Gfo/Idh/MocA family oxidoreductase [Planctomycetota bacterium]|nr:Gfo/Idh/MocA family oxidoreductase [Planctomycetota bacterium]
MSGEKTLRMALVGGGMFGGDVVLRSIEDLERCGLAPYLGRIGLDHRARAVGALEPRLVAIGTRTEATASRLARAYRERVPGASPVPYHGERPWEEILTRHEIDRVFVATPDPLHVEPTRQALLHGAHVLVEKPLVLSTREADELLRLSREKGLVVGVDMHKRYDPCHRFLFEDLVSKIGTPLYGRAVLEEPLDVSTKTFQWAAASNPFTYVGVHWADLFLHYLGLEPASVHAVGQKELLCNWDREGGDRPIDAFDAMQVAVDYASGLRVYYVNNWVNPREFEGHVNQEMELVGTRGKIEFDQQYRGLRATITGVGSKTYNPHFTMDVRRSGLAGAPPAYDGYGKDSVVAIVERAAEVHLGLAARDDLRSTYPDLESARPTVQVLEAAAEVAVRNHAHLGAGRGSPVTARITPEAIDVLDPIAGNERIYARAPGTP